MNFDWRMGIFWLGWLLCQKVLRLDHLRLGELTHGWKAACKRVRLQGKRFMPHAGLELEISIALGFLKQWR